MIRILLLTLFVVLGGGKLCAQASGLLPVVHISVEDGKEILSKYEYLRATLYIDAKNIKGLESLGNEEQPIEILIRGRGNYTWWNEEFKKKPYKIKFQEKTSILGMPKNKHYALLAHADDKTGFLRNTIGFECSRLFGLKYTPSQYPVEVILNGDYKGIYFLTETIRIDKKRLNIPEPEDNSLEPDNSWLVEIDNYEMQTGQVHLSLDNTNLHAFNITYHSPEELSSNQDSFIRDQFERFKELLFVVDKQSNNNQFEEFIDLESLAKYYIIAEVTDHLEAFLGSCYMYREKGGKWHFGPVWDFGQAFNTHHEKDKFIYQGNTNFPHSIIEQIVKFKCFQDAVIKYWPEFYPGKFNQLFGVIDDFVNMLSEAAICDYNRWPQYGINNMVDKAKIVKEMLVQKCTFLNAQWMNSLDVISNRDDRNSSYDVFLYDIHGKRILGKFPNQLYIEQRRYQDGRIISRKVIN